MKLTGLGKVVIFIVIVGLAIGGWRMYQEQQGGGKGGLHFPKGYRGNSAPTDDTPPDGPVEITFVLTAAKADWGSEQVKLFNERNQGKYIIKTVPVPSREAMHKILAKELKPVLWSPGSPIWPSRLAEKWKEDNGATILDMNDNTAYRVFLRSPLVFLTTKKKAEFLRPLLGGSDPWGSLRKLSLGQIRVPWGKFVYSHADPIGSSSGMMTLGLILADYYNTRHPEAGSPEQVAESKQFRNYLGDLAKSLRYDKPAREGTTKLTKAFVADTKRYDVITAYESTSLSAAAENSELAVIYPNPTSYSEHALSLLNADWVTPRQKEGALAFMTFLGQNDAIRAGLKYKFRPVQSLGNLSLGPELASHGRQGFKQSPNSADLPPYKALNSIASYWSTSIMRQ